MKIDFPDPDIPFSHTPLPDNFPRHFSTNIFPRHFSLKHPHFSRESAYIYSCARISEHVQNILTNLLKVD